MSRTAALSNGTVGVKPPRPAMIQQNPLRSLFVAAAGLFSMLYLLNPTGGLIELIPDNFPLFGNFDEMAATTVLLAALSYFGIDLTRFFKAAAKSRREEPVVEAESRVVRETR